jgi:hypothetical protein
MWRAYRTLRLSVWAVIFVGAVAIAIWRAPLAMLPFVAVALGLCLLLGWWAAPKKAPRASIDDISKTRQVWGSGISGPNREREW